MAPNLVVYGYSLPLSLRSLERLTKLRTMDNCTNCKTQAKPYSGGVLLNWAVSDKTEPVFASVCSSKAAGNRSTSGWPVELSIGAPVRPVCCRSRKPLNFAAKEGPTPHAARKITGRPAQATCSTV